MKKTTVHAAGMSLIVGTADAGCGGTSNSSSSGSMLMAIAAACYSAWNSMTAYNGGAQVSHNGVNYTAAFRTQNQNPSTNNGPAGNALDGSSSTQWQQAGRVGLERGRSATLVPAIASIRSPR